jgi:DNA mismatch repair protein MutL
MQQIAEEVIHVLPDHVVDRIAAGEVVERPASVVKELVENALDAGASSIAVDVEAGGRRLIRIVDDGVGMSPSDARRALLRHATSKLREVDDLWTLGTMGFRGEALPSIASVSRMTVVTRRRGDLAATRLDLDGGRVIEEGELGAPPGTCIEVRDLLHNVPARLKFLKGEATEASHVTEVVQRLAMTHPRVQFRLRQNGRIALDAPACTIESDEAAGLERARMLLGGRLAGRLHLTSGGEGGVGVIAYLAAPELAQTTPRGVQLFVGRRFVRDRSLLHAVTMGYGELVPRGRYPVAIVIVDVPGGSVDVNVHPQKLEVRFSDAGAVASAVRHVVRKGLATAPWLGEAAGVAPLHSIASMAPPVERAADLAGRYAEATTRALFPMGGLGRPAQQTRLAESRPTWGAAVERVRAAPPPPPVEVAAPPQPASDFFGRMRYLGQLDRTYLVCEGDGEMVLIDQHAAHERVEFQRLRERSTTRDVPVQRLLFPQTVDVPPAHHAIVADLADVLAAVGFEVEPFGGATVAIKAMPAGLRHDPATVLRELLAELADSSGSRAVEERLDHVLATVACHSVVRAGDVLSPREAEALLAQMDGVDFRAHCPHGRPVLLRIGVAEIGRRLGR